MSILLKLFGRKETTPSATAEAYNGYRIYPEPAKTGGGFRVSARIEKDFGGEIKTHQMIRADTISTIEEATATTLKKAQILIDEQGDQIFG